MQRGFEMALTGGRYLPEVRADDLAAALADPAELARQDPTSPSPSVMAERMRIEGGDLTARDHAAFEAMMAVARERRFADDEYVLSGRVLQTYLGVSDWRDVEATLERLIEVRVRFDVRRKAYREWGVLPLVLPSSREGAAGREVVYSFPSQLRRLFESELVTYLELAALPRFKSKYTARLYARLARRAGFSADKRRPWSIAPERLAEDLGWNYKGYGPFKLRVLDKSVAEINQHVRRFGVTLREETAARGKVTAIVFETFERERRADEQQVEIFASARALDALGGADPAHVGDLIPEDGWVLRVAKALDVRPADLAHGWRAALDEARLGVFREDLPEATPADLAGQDLLDVIEEDGLDDAFERWAGGAARTGRHLDGAQANRFAREEAVRAAIVTLDREWESAEAVVIRLARKGDDNQHLAAAAQRVIAWPWVEGRSVHVTVVVPSEGESLHYDLSVKSLPKAAVSELRSHPGVASLELLSARPAATQDAAEGREETIEEKMRRHRRSSSEHMLECVASRHTTPSMVPDLLDPEMSPWSFALQDLSDNDARALRGALVRLRRPLSYALDDALAEDPERAKGLKDWGAKVTGLSEKAKATMAKLAEAYHGEDLKHVAKIAWAVMKSVPETPARPRKGFSAIRAPRPSTVSLAYGEETEVVLDA
jgi:hypothetical protein